MPFNLLKQITFLVCKKMILLGILMEGGGEGGGDNGVPLQNAMQ